jgi:hypothetical protein
MANANSYSLYGRNRMRFVGIRVDALSLDNQVESVRAKVTVRPVVVNCEWFLEP